MAINFYCEFNQTGIGRHAESFYIALRHIASKTIKFNYIHSGLETAIKKFLHSGSHADDVTLFFWRQEKKLLDQIQGKKIIWVVFESNQLPQKWVTQIANFDEIWSPTEWGKSVLVEHGLPAEKITVLPEGINEKIYFPQREPHDKFIFLNVGKYEQRKSIDELIIAFILEFPHSIYPHVELWLKADFFTRPKRIEHLKEKIHNESRIKIISGHFSDKEMATLYNQADAFVYPSKSEGFGLTGLEAIACGLPMIAIDYSGQQQYLKAMTHLFYPIQYELKDIIDLDYIHYYGHDYINEPFGQWAVPELQSLRTGMREVYENIECWRGHADIASKIIRQQFTWQKVAAEAAILIMNSPL